MRRLLVLVAAGLVLAGCATGAGDYQVTPAVSVPSTASTAPPVPAAPGLPKRVALPRLGIVDDIVPVGIAPNGEMELPPVEQTGWFDLGPLPGATGPAVLAGHVDWKGQPGALGRIGELKPGDLIVVTDAAGLERTFAVDTVVEIKKVDFQKATVPLVFGATAGPELRLVTCSGPVVARQYLNNTIAAAHLIA